PDLLDHLEDMLRAGRTYRNDHGSRRLQLLQKRRGDVIDAAGDDDLVERRRLFPAVIAVAIFGGDHRIFAITRANQATVHAAGALGELGDDLDRMDVRREIGEQRRLKARAGADLEHLIAWTNFERARHAAHRAGRRDGDPETDVEIVPDIGV